jgi:hypothetical protein
VLDHEAGRSLKLAWNIDKPEIVRWQIFGRMQMELELYAHGVQLHKGISHIPSSPWYGE